MYLLVQSCTVPIIPYYVKTDHLIDSTKHMVYWRVHQISILLWPVQMRTEHENVDTDEHIRGDFRATASIKLQLNKKIQKHTFNKQENEKRKQKNRFGGSRRSVFTGPCV